MMLSRPRRRRAARLQRGQSGKSLRRVVSTGRRRTLTSAPEVPPRPPTGTRRQTARTAGRSACELVQVAVPVSPPLIAALLGPSPKDVPGGVRKLSGWPSFGGRSDLGCPPGIPSSHLPRKRRGERGPPEHPSPRWPCRQRRGVSPSRSRAPSLRSSRQTRHQRYRSWCQSSRKPANARAWHAVQFHFEQPRAAPSGLAECIAQG